MFEDKKNYPLHNYIKQNQLFEAKSILSKESGSLFLEDDDKRTTLHWACSINNLDFLKSLLDEIPQNNQIVLDDYVDLCGWTPIHISAALGNIEMLKLLLNKFKNPQPNVNLVTNNGSSVIHLSVSKNNYEMVKFLIEECNASCDIKDKNGQSPLHRASSSGLIKIIEFLNDHNVDINDVDKNGWTPLHHALSECNGDAAVLLVKLGANTEIKDNHEKKPIDVVFDKKVITYFNQSIEELI